MPEVRQVADSLNWYQHKCSQKFLQIVFVIYVILFALNQFKHIVSHLRVVWTFFNISGPLETCFEIGD